MNAALLMLIALLGAHWFFDYAGQGDFMARAKHRLAPIHGIPWDVILVAHAGIHAAAVALITGVWWLFVLEFVAHFLTDWAKCEGQISFRTDQSIHLGCKVVWWLLVLVIL